MQGVSQQRCFAAGGAEKQPDNFIEVRAHMLRLICATTTISALICLACLPVRPVFVLVPHRLLKAL